MRCYKIVFSFILHNQFSYRQDDKDRLSRKLFILIASSDLLTNSYPVLHILYFCISPNIDFSIITDFSSQSVDPTFKHYAIPSLFICSFGCLSQVSTFVLAIVRMISVYRPFFNLRYPQWIPLVYVSVFSTLMFMNEISFAAFHYLGMNDSVKHAIEFTVEFCFCLNITHFVFGILASFATVFKILWKRQPGKAKQVVHVRSCWIIFLMNVPYIFSIINYALCKTHFQKYGYFYLVYVAVPCFTSMFNPCVIVLLDTDLKQYIRALVYRMLKSSNRNKSIQESRSL